MSEKRPIDYSSLALAYIGDGVYDIFIREKMINEHPDYPAHKLHMETVKFVSANAQSLSMERIEESLTEEEMAVYKRGRNAKSPTSAKNASIIDYRRATGFEALLGFLHLSGEFERLQIIMTKAYNAVKKGQI